MMNEIFGMSEEEYIEEMRQNLAAITRIMEDSEKIEAAKMLREWLESDEGDKDLKYVAIIDYISVQNECIKRLNDVISGLVATVEMARMMANSEVESLLRLLVGDEDD